MVGESNTHRRMFQLGQQHVICKTLLSVSPFTALRNISTEDDLQSRCAVPHPCLRLKHSFKVFLTFTLASAQPPFQQMVGKSKRHLRMCALGQQHVVCKPLVSGSPFTASRYISTEEDAQSRCDVTIPFLRLEHHLMYFSLPLSPQLSP